MTEEGILAAAMGFLTIWGGVLLLTGVLRSLGRQAEPGSPRERSGSARTPFQEAFFGLPASTT